MHTVLSMDAIVISFGGSIILSDDTDVSFFKNLKTLLEKLSKQYKIYIVVGGGNTARTYIKLGRKLKLEEKVFLNPVPPVFWEALPGL